MPNFCGYSNVKKTLSATTVKLSSFEKDNFGLIKNFALDIQSEIGCTVSSNDADQTVTLERSESATKSKIMSGRQICELIKTNALKKDPFKDVASSVKPVNYVCVLRDKFVSPEGILFTKHEKKRDRVLSAI